jgi:hypothetical protein
LSNSAAGAGTENTGGGGGGGQHPIPTNGGAGGSGVVIVRYPIAYRAATTTGSSVTYTTTATHRIYQFLASGSITF